MNIELIKEKFDDYVKSYDMDDHMIALKYYHSYRVMDLCAMIAKENNFDEDDMNIALLTGLLHDYARFEQWTKYKTYNDIKSIDHGDLAVLKLFDNNEIVEFCTQKEYYDEIYDAIKYHNKLYIPNDLSEHNLKMCQLVRDADKLDILYLYTIDKTLLLEDDKEISEEAKKLFFSNKPLNREVIKSLNDKILLSLAFIFDINYDYSFKYIKEHQLIEKIFNQIENKDRFKIYFDYIIKYIEKRVNNVRK